MASPRDPAPMPRRGRRPDPMAGGWIWGVVLIVVAVLLIILLGSTQFGSLDYSEFTKLVKEKKIAKVIFRNGVNVLVADLNKGVLEELEPALKKKVRAERFEVQLWEGIRYSNDLTKLLEDNGVVVDVEPAPVDWLGPIVTVILPTIILIAFFMFFLMPRIRDPFGGSMLNSYIRSPAKRYDKSKNRVTFDDVADMTSAKTELQEIVDFLKNPDKFIRLGAQIPKGVLLVGPPGTGKTLLARAVAGEAGVPFFSISGSEFIQMFVGVGASRVRDMFRTAKENAPCLLFVDEIDAVGRMRGAGVGGGSDEREQTLNQILSEMDGFTPTESVIVLAATNRPDVLDSALLRPGRFDRHVTIGRPTWQGRLDILKIHTRNKPLADDVRLEQIARRMIGMTGADLRNLANEAALLAARENKPRIERIDFERAADRVLIGPKRDEVLNDEQRRQTAYHEAGHALVSWFLPEADLSTKVSIVPRGQAGGVTFYSPDEEQKHYSLAYFKDRLASAMGGRAAERLIFRQTFAGVEMDLKQATRLARYMVTHWGMSDRLGPMAFRVGEEHVFLGKEIQEARDFSEATARIIDEEVEKLLREADDRAFSVLTDHRTQMEQLVAALMEKEEVLQDELEQILGPAAGDRPLTRKTDTDSTTAIQEKKPDVPPADKPSSE